MMISTRKVQEITLANLKNGDVEGTENMIDELMSTINKFTK